MIKIRKSDYITFQSLARQGAAAESTESALRATIADLKAKKDTYKAMSTEQHDKVKRLRMYELEVMGLREQVERGNETFQAEMAVWRAKVEDRDRVVQAVKEEMRGMKEDLGGLERVKGELERMKLRCKELEGQVEAWKTR